MMNQAHEPLEDSRDEQLAAIERQLRKARPLAPQLDLATLERLARETPPSVEEEPQVVVKPPAPASRRIRSYAAVAGAWICGAIVGAAAMFLYEGGKPSDVPAQPSAAIANDMTTKSPPTRKDELRRPRVDLVVSDHTGTRDLSWLMSAERMNLNGHSPQRPTWRVGMCLPSLAAASRWNVDGARDTDLDPAWESPARGRAAPPAESQDLESAPGVTRQQLLRDLLGNAAGPVL